MLVLFVILFLFISTSNSFQIGKSLKTEETTASNITGKFTLILYGGRYYDDLETIAILDKEEDKFTFEPYAPDFDYTIKKDVPAKEALKEAEKFVSFHNSFWKSQLSRIIDDKGNTIGYEVRPLYLPAVIGVSDVLEVNYWLKEGGRVKTLIRLSQSAERRRSSIGDKDRGTGAH
jgi:hypothetical protein